MLNGTPMKKIERSYKLPGMFIASHVLIYGLLALFCFPSWESGTLIFSNILIESLAVLFWAIATYKDPGYIQKPKNADFLELM
jgi:hypothetical protein